MEIVEKEEKEDIQHTEKCLNERKTLQEKTLKKYMREHHYCLREIFVTLEELESATEQEIDLEILQDIL